MSQFTWDDYKKSLKDLSFGSLPEHLEAPKTKDIIIDTRTDKKNMWFLPIRGKNYNGHDFIEKAFREKKIIGAFCEREELDRFSPQIQKNLIVVSCALKALQKIAMENRKKATSGIVFAITGSVGKTTTKNMLEAIVKQTKAPYVASEKNYNNEIGVPLTLLKVEPKHKFIVLEMGARKQGDIRELTQIAKPNISICLNVGSSHLSTFKDKNAIYKTKLEARALKG